MGCFEVPGQEVAPIGSLHFDLNCSLFAVELHPRMVQKKAVQQHYLIESHYIGRSCRNILHWVEGVLPQRWQGRAGALPKGEYDEDIKNPPLTIAQFTQVLCTAIRSVLAEVTRIADMDATAFHGCVYQMVRARHR